MKRFLLPLTLILGTLAAEDYDINLKDPVFSNGTVSTDQGGIISNPGLRIQARHIEYTNKVEDGVTIRKISAEGDLLLEFEGRVFTGKKLTYDLITKTGTMYDGRTSTEYYYLGGEEIELLEDGSFSIKNAYLTTVESQDTWWEIRSARIDINNKGLLTAKNIKFNFFDVPVFWIPSFKLNTKVVKE
jgi:lipopolysaccharide assembly outer membrane protein LptD (OstA)